MKIDDFIKNRWGNGGASFSQSRNNAQFYRIFFLYIDYYNIVKNDICM